MDMTQTFGMNDQMTNEDTPPTAAEIEAWQRDAVFAGADKIGPDMFPRLWNMSAGPMNRAVIRPVTPEPPEYVTVPLRTRGNDDSIKRDVAIARWNSLWEAAQFRRRFFDEDTDLTPELAAIADRGDINVIFVPRTPSRYYEYAPLYHLLSRGTCERFGLPPLAGGQWPFSIELGALSKYLPADFESRLARAWAATVWRHLNSGSRMAAFSAKDPIRLLAHNLDYWIPPVTAVIQDTLSTFPTVAGEGELPDEIELVDGTVLVGATPGWPRQGGDVWRGEDDAVEIIASTVEQADDTGNLRGILDAVRSHRVQDDFSDHWSNARIDFERKLHRTRNKISVKFVELKGNIPVQGPETEVEGSMVCSDFMALLNEQEREVVVLLSAGYTRLQDVAELMGYATHSPVSKKLARIRRQAIRFFNERD